MRRAYATLLISAMLVALLPVAATPAMAHTESEPFAADLVAGKNIDVGDVLVWNDEDYIYVKMITSGSWFIQETHLQAAPDASLIPQTKNGNPIPGQFDLGERFCAPVQEALYAVALGSGSPESVCIAVHAAVAEEAAEAVWANEQSAWGEGSPFPGANWATYLSYDVQGWELVGAVTLGSKGPGETTLFALESGMEYKFVSAGKTFDGYIDVPTNSYIDVPTNSFIDIPTNSFIDIPTGKFIEMPAKGYLEIDATSAFEIGTSDIIDVPTIHIIDIPTLHIIDIPTNSFRYTATEGFFVSLCFSDSTPASVDVYVWR